MSTKATIIIIEGIEYAKIYQHWDGQPEHTLEYLIAFNEDFYENRGDGPEYKFAQFLRFTARLENVEKYKLDNSLYTGWGVIPFNQYYGQQFEYTLNKDGTVTYQLKVIY